MEKDQIPPRIELPMLEEKTEENDTKNQLCRRRFIRVYRLYMITSATLVVMCSLLMLFLTVGNQSNDFLGGVADFIAKGFAFVDLIDLSGKSPESVGGENTSDYGTDKDSDAGRVENTEKEEYSDVLSEPPMTLETLYHYDYNAVPKGEIPILPMDLSLISYGASHINNATGLTPDIPTLLQSRLDEGSNWTTDAPVVLILHTHGTESYSDDGAISYRDDGSELARSDDIHQNVVSVGRVFAEELERLGIRTIHCMTMHDKNGYKDAYARAEETIRVYLEKYPSIRLVIDLHRDSIVSSEGNLIRPVTVVNGEAVAQVMCVVGSDWGGEENQRWKGNLSLALQLRSTLNESFGNICRPTYLKASTYNQEIAPYSLLLEIGASGNSLEEAQRAAIVVARSLAELIKNNK